MEYLDTDPELLPYTDYECMVTAANSEGTVASEWSRVKTSEAAPEGMLKPRITVREIESKIEPTSKM